MKNADITIAAGIFPPDIGGPATYVSNLLKKLSEMGIGVFVVAYSNSENIGQKTQNGGHKVVKVSRDHFLLARYFLYFWKLVKLAKNSDLIYAFDAFSAGIPACLAAKLLRKKFTIRLGGDFGWEKYLEKTGEKITLRGYYENNIYKKQKIHYWILKKVLESADLVIFSSNLQRDIYLKRFDFLEHKSSVIQNTFFCGKNTKMESAQLSHNGSFRQKTGFRPDFKYILFASRFIGVKNADALISAFAAAASRYPDLKLVMAGEGPRAAEYKYQIAAKRLEGKVILMPPFDNVDLAGAIKNSLFCVLPSLTDISPNFAFDCLSVGKPLVLTKESEYFRLFPDLFVFCDPLNEKDIEEKIEFLLDERNRRNYVEKILKFRYNYKRNFYDVAREHIKIFETLLN